MIEEIKKNSESEDSQTAGLRKALYSLEKVRISHVRKEVLKSKVFQNIHLQAPEFFVSSALKMRIKERVFAYIESHSQKKFFWSNFFIWQKRFVAAFLLFLMIFAAVSYFGVSPKVVFAGTITTLYEFEGDVEIFRDGKSIDLQAGMEILEKDRVVTRLDGSATIKFFDDTISRLSDSTSLSVEKLFKLQDSVAKTYVEVEVFEGEMWSRVVNLPLQEASFVVDAQDLRLSTQKGAFNVKVRSDEVTVDVYNHTLQYSTPAMEDKVLSGKKVVFNADKSLQVEEIDEEEKRAQWVVDNLNFDQEYLLEVEQRLLLAKMESLGVEADEEFSFSNTFGERTLLFLTFDDVKQGKLELDLAEKNFVAAQIKLQGVDLSEGERSKVKSAIENFSAKVRGFYDLVDEVKITDPDYGFELQRYVEDKVLSQKKVLSLVSKDDPVFSAKEAVDELELLSARDEREFVEFKAKQALDRYFEGDNEALDEVVQVVSEYEYDDKFADVIADLVRTEAEVEVVLVLDDVSDVGDQVAPQTDDVNVTAEVVIEEVQPVADTLINENVFDLQEEYGVEVEGDKPLDPLLY